MSAPVPASSKRALRPTVVDPQPLATMVADLGLRMLGDAGTVMVRDITLDSRQVAPGCLYVALPGTRTHGAHFAAQAVRAGAAAILTDAAGAAMAADAGVPLVVADSPRHAMAHIASRLFGEPSHGLFMAGITGTNGKTTTAFLLESALRATGHRVGTIGTIGFRLEGRPLRSTRGTVTTPESCDLQALLAVMAERGADAVAMEVSSHALAFDRVEGVRFDVAAFTNLGRDHLDFHRTQEDYFEAKARLFTSGMTCRAVINADDEWGRVLAERVRATGDVELTTFGFGPAADYRVLAFGDSGTGGEHVELDAAGRRLSFDIALPGRYNAANAATCVAMLDRCGVDLDSALPGLATAQVPGRMQRIHLPGDAPRVYVDFAHTPQAVASALSAVHGRTIVVVGAGGDRDRAKREPMGRIAAQNADVVVVTDDNPRTEDPASIRAAVLAGARSAGRAEAIDGGERRHAIALALSLAEPGDAVAVLGKGHETTQDIGGVLHTFDDTAVIEQEWARLHEGAAGDGERHRGVPEGN